MIEEDTTYHRVGDDPFRTEAQEVPEDTQTSKWDLFKARVVHFYNSHLALAFLVLLALAGVLWIFLPLHFDVPWSEGILMLLIRGFFISLGMCFVLLLASTPLLGAEDCPLLTLLGLPAAFCTACYFLGGAAGDVPSSFWLQALKGATALAAGSLSWACLVGANDAFSKLIDDGEPRLKVHHGARK